MKLVALDSQLVHQAQSGSTLPVLSAPWAVKLWCELLIAGLRGPLRLVVATGQFETVNQTIQMLCDALEQSGLDLCNDDHWRRAQMRRVQPEVTDRICELDALARPAHKYIDIIGCPLDSNEGQWSNALQDLAHLIADGFDDLQLTTKEYRLSQLEQPFKTIGGAARRVVLIDSYAWTACLATPGGGRAEARDSVAWLLSTLFSNKRADAELGLVTCEHWDPKCRVDPLEIAKGFGALIADLDPSGRRVPSAWVTVQSHKRPRDDRVHARFIRTEFGAWVVDPGIDQLVAVHDGKLRVPHRALVRVARREDETLIRRLIDPQRRLGECRIPIRPSR